MRIDDYLLLNFPGVNFIYILFLIERHILSHLMNIETYLRCLCIVSVEIHNHVLFDLQWTYTKLTYLSKSFVVMWMLENFKVTSILIFEPVTFESINFSRNIFSVYLVQNILPCRMIKVVDLKNMILYNYPFRVPAVWN